MGPLTAPAGTLAVIFVPALFTVTFVIGFPASLTTGSELALWLKPTPLIVTTVPTGPLFGDIAPMMLRVMPKVVPFDFAAGFLTTTAPVVAPDRKSTRLNSSHLGISY